MLTKIENVESYESIPDYSRIVENLYDSNFLGVHCKATRICSKKDGFNYFTRFNILNHGEIRIVVSRYTLEDGTTDYINFNVVPEFISFKVIYDSTSEYNHSEKYFHSRCCIPVYTNGVLAMEEVDLYLWQKYENNTFNIYFGIGQDEIADLINSEKIGMTVYFNRIKGFLMDDVAELVDLINGEVI